MEFKGPTDLINLLQRQSILNKIKFVLLKLMILKWDYVPNKVFLT